MKNKTKKRMEGPKVSIIISSYNQKELVQKNIESLRKNLKISYKIYFVDDSGNGEIAPRIRKKFPFVKIIINKKNEGFSKSYNKGIKLAKKEYNPDWFLILNDDCEVKEKELLKKIISKTKKYPVGGIFGIKLIYPDKSVQWAVKKGKNYFYQKEGEEYRKEFSRDSKPKEVIGAFMLIKKEFFEDVGLFDEKFSPFYGEESDLCFRGIKKGWEIIYIGGFEIIHHRNKSISKLSEEDVWFIKKRNSIRLEWKHYGILKNLKMTIIHFGSILKKNGIKTPKKLKLLLKAYGVNIKNG